MDKRSILLWVSAFFLLAVSAASICLFAKPQVLPNTLQNMTLVAPVSENEHIRGNPRAPVTIVIYSDLQCPACAAVNQSLRSVEIAYADKVRFVYRHFPLPQHKNAILAAVASESAGKQGKFFEMRDLAYDTQREWTNRSQFDAYLYFLSQARSLELDLEQFQRDMNDPKLLEVVTNGIKDGMSLKLQVVPVFFINGKSFQPHSIDELKQKLDEALDAR